MPISEIEIREFDYRIPDIGTDNGRPLYRPGSTLEPPGFILTIRTDDGLEGNYRGFMMTPPMVTQIKMAADEFLIGRDPLEREGIWQDIWKSFRHMDHFGLGPIDIALWDLAGKKYDETISNLLGGFRDTIPAYASTHASDDSSEGLSTPDAYAKFAQECADKGYGGFKIHAFGEPEKDISVCRAVSNQIDGEIELMLDPASEYQTYSKALRVGQALDEFGFLWYEDPLADTGASANSTRRLASNIDTPLLGCEHVRGGPFARADHISMDALDLVRADAHLDGGITSVMKIANTAEAFGLDVELHLGGPSHLHCISAIRNTQYFEKGLVHPDAGWVESQGFKNQIEEINDSGEIPVPDEPGLGVEIDWEFVEDRLTNHTLVDQSSASTLS